MNIKLALDAIVATLAGTNPEPIPLIARKSEIRVHAGKFAWDELKARNYSAPSVFVTCLGFQKPNEEAAHFAYPHRVFDVRFAAGIVAKSPKDRETRNAMARAIAEQIALCLAAEPTWGDDSIEKPDANRIRAEGLFVPAAEADNQSLWLVSWYQLVQLDPDSVQTLDDFDGFDADHFEPGADIDNDQPLAQTTADYPE